MKFSVATLFAGLSVLSVLKQVQCARILAIIPTPSYSHQIPYRPLWLELNKRGHDVVLVTPNPIPDLKLEKFTQIDISTSYIDMRQKFNMVQHRFKQMTCLDLIRDTMPELIDTFAEHVFNHTQMRKIYAPNSGQKFDLIMVEMLLMPAVYAFAHRFNASLIGLSSLGIPAHNEHVLGGLVLPSHETTWELDGNAGSNLPFWKRLRNFVNLWRSIYYHYRDIIPRQQKIAEKYLGPNLPSLLEIQKNTSLIFVNQPDAIAAARPKLTNLITFSSFHVNRNPTPLPENLKRFADDAPNGFIYFSLGSNAMSSDLPEETLQVFLDVFAKLPYKVMWKFEKEFPKLPNNVMVSPWFPQQSILAHPNIKLFIYQGGLQSTEETIHFTVPVVVFPVGGDQDYQAIRMEAVGVGKRLEIVTVTRDELENAIREVITNKKYKEKIIQLKNVVNDKPYDMVDHLVWWTEYTIRHRGASHLRSNLAWQPWYQRNDMDIVVLFTIVAFIIVSTTLTLLAKFAVCFCRRIQAPDTYQKQKLSIRWIVVTRSRSGVFVIMNFVNIAIILSVAGVLLVIQQVQCARILAIIPTPSYSHQIPFRPLWIELSKRGHEIVFVSPNPIPDVNLTNFVYINTLSSIIIDQKIDIFKYRFEQTTWIEFVQDRMSNFSDVVTHAVFNNTEVMKLYAPNSGVKFDLVMAEMLLTPALFAFGHRFNAPIIGLTSLGLYGFNEYILGGVVLPSHESTWEMEANTGSNLPFWKRLHNFATLWHSMYIIYSKFVPQQQKIAEEYLGTRLPSLLDIQRNLSLVFTNQADGLAAAKPKLANMITFTSAHVSSNPKPLPEKLKRFVDDAHNGFIYFSLGSNVLSSEMPKETLQIFLDVFARLPYKIVWKYEEELAMKPSNVFISPWFTQQSILAHPNIKLFIYQGGLQSTEEAVKFAVPVLGIPMIADQTYQTGRMEALGVGKHLDITSITRDELESAIREIITDKSYKKRMIELQNTVHDQPYDLVKNLVWWTEYVIRHKGAPHLRSSLAWQPWYQRNDMDIVIFLTVVATIIVLIILRLIAMLAMCFFKGNQSLPSYRKQKLS
ncbi:uncharacterized protein LOC128875172 [Hylaeus volcanicus]|uniref:uncharacterized protein LOC128875172 n=1 Tax=Hylaeus volcanicus TaxID=313075 RepID=UPI0023B877E6|nr:uncharacterized protein LOC128875172 [Hylaeus volcanicus]